MARKSRVIAAAAVVVPVLLSAVAAFAQGMPPPVTRVASLGSGSISGVVRDERGAAVAGVMVSAVGATTAFAVTDSTGRFELPTLAPGPYLVRAHVTGFIASRGQTVEVRPGVRATSAIALRRVPSDARTQPYPVLAAGLGPSGASESGAPTAGQPDSIGTAGTASASGDDDHGELAWRLRHARRGILKDATLPEDFLAGGAPPNAGGAFGESGLFGKAAESSAHLAASFFSATPFSGQVNLLTTGSFDTPQQLFSTDGFARGIAYLALSAPAGEHADWTVRGAFTQGDVASWIVAAAYASHVPERHQYDVGLSYSTQRYATGSPSVLRDGTSGSRSVGGLYGFDTFTITPAVALTYGARVARYDYLDQPGLVSPKFGVTVSPAEHFRVDAAISRRALAPGAEEFVPPIDSAIWLPPQRTFSSIAPDHRLEAEHSNHVALEVERDLGATIVSARTFRQHVTDQLATLFGVDLPGMPSTRLGHYVVANAGDVDVAGWSAGFRTPPVARVRGSIEYSQARARWNGTTEDMAYLVLLTPAARRLESERVHDLATRVETEVPETSTRVLVLYKVSNAFAAATDRSTFDARFDVQVRQSLPFMDFSSAKWEMLVAVRNVFREAALDSSIYDELLVVRPPKRLVGGLTLRF